MKAWTAIPDSVFPSQIRADTPFTSTTLLVLSNVTFILPPQSKIYRFNTACNNHPMKQAQPMKVSQISHPSQATPWNRRLLSCHNL